MEKHPQTGIDLGVHAAPLLADPWCPQPNQNDRQHQRGNEEEGGWRENAVDRWVPFAPLSPGHWDNPCVLLGSLLPADNPGIVVPDADPSVP